MASVTINGKTHEVTDGITIIQACEQAEVEVPRFCYHDRLKIAGNCRMCLVEVEGMPPKPVASCAMPINEGMKIHTDSPMVKKAREGVMEFLLANHPLDCPICDQGGECDLQDQAFQYGAGKSEYHEGKRAVVDKNMGPIIKTQMTRCIHCTRCVRFIEDVAGTTELGAVFRGENMQITTYLEKSVSSELSGNVIDLCPVGALTSKPYAFKARSWELTKTESIDVMDAVGSNIRIDSRGLEVMRILPRLNEEINEEWISDKTRYAYEGLKSQRLDRPYIKNDGRFEVADFSDACKEAAKKLSSLKGEEIAILSGSVSAIEDIFALKKLAEAAGIKQTECRLAEEKIDSQDRASYLFNTTIAGIEQADVCLLVGVNPRKDAPILNARIRKRFLTKNLKIAAIGVNTDLTYEYEKLGDDVAVLNDVLDGKSDFSKVLKNAKNPMIIVGQDVVSREDGAAILNISKKIAEKYDMIREGDMVSGGWNGFNFLAKSTGLINGLELDFVSEKGIADICEKANSGKIKAVILHGVDDDIDFESLKNVFVVYIGSHGDKGAGIADVILPASAYSEKEVIYVNLEGRPQLTKRAVFAPANVKEDWEVIRTLAEKMNLTLSFANISELSEQIFEKNPNLKDIDQVAKASWVKTGKSDNSITQKSLVVKDFDFYLTNAIARSSKTLNNCSAENSKSS